MGLFLWWGNRRRFLCFFDRGVWDLSLLYAFGLAVWRLRGHVAACTPMVLSVDDLSFLVGSCEVGGFYFYSFLADWEGRMRCESEGGVLNG
jgi:hypothetical protein